MPVDRRKGKEDSATITVWYCLEVLINERRHNA